MSLPCMSVKATMTVSILRSLTSAASCSLVSKISPRGLAVAASSPSHEALEEHPRPPQVRGQLLRVTLHRHDQAVVGLDPFHSAGVALRPLQQAPGPRLP